MRTRTLPAALPVAMSAALLAVQFPMAVVLAQASSDPWQVLRGMELAGEAAFSRDRVAAALVADQVTLRVLRRPLDAEAAAAVAERVRELHRRGGYARAEAHGEVAVGGLRITLAAGSRYRCGDVRCSGNTLVATARLRELLANGERGSPVWQDGEFPDVEAIARRVAAVARAAYREIGRHGVEAKVELVPVDDRMALEVSLANEGREVRIQGLQLIGEDEAQREPVLAAVRFSPGSLATTDALADLQRQFEATGRYLSVTVDVPAEGPAGAATLPVTVKARPGAPTLGTLPARDVEQVQKAIDHLLARMRQGSVLSNAFDLSEPIAWGPIRLLPGRVTFLFSRDGIAASADRLQWATAPPVTVGMGLFADQLVAAVGERGGAWRFRDALGLQARLTSTFEPTGEALLRWGVGMSTQPGNGLELLVHPATATHLLVKATEVRRHGDELAMRLGDTTVRISADGEIVGQQVVIGSDDDFTIALSHVPLSAQLKGLLPAAAPGAKTDVAAMLLEAASAILVDVLSATAGEDARVRALLRGCAEAAAASASGTTSPSPAAPALNMPSFVARTPLSFESVIAGFVSIPAVDQRWTGRIVDLSAAFGALLQGDARTANARFLAIANDDAHGPLSLSIASVLNGLVGSERNAAMLRERAVARWSFDAFYADAMDLAGNLALLEALPGRVGRRWRGQPELQELCAGLPAGAEGDRAAWRKGLELLWSAGGGAKLRDALLGP